MRTACNAFFAAPPPPPPRPQAADQTTFIFRVPEGTIFGECSALRVLGGESKAKRRDNVFSKTACDLLKVRAEAYMMGWRMPSWHALEVAHP